MTEITLPKRRSFLHLAVLRHRGFATVSLTIIAVAAAVALLAPIISPDSPNKLDVLNAYQLPSSSHVLGTDSLGRDLLSRLIWGSRSALVGPFFVIVVATVTGVALAIVAAWRGGWIDTVVSAFFNILFSFPAVLLAILAAAVLGAGLTTSVVAIAVAYVPYFGRIVRSEAIRQRSLPYVAALEIQGVSSWRACLRHLLPNLSTLILAQMTASFGYAMIDLASLSFLGLGVQPPTADWGQMVASGQAGILAQRPAESMYAGACIVLIVIAFTTLGDRLVARVDEVRA